MGFREVDRAGAAHPMLEVKRVTLDDGLHASLILENGRISKLVSPSGEVAVLKWEGDQISPRPSAASASRAAPPRLSPRGRPAGAPEGFVAARHFWASKSIGGPQQQPTGLGRIRGSSSECSVSVGRAPANTSDSSEGSVRAPPALPQGPSVPKTVLEDIAGELGSLHPGGGDKPGVEGTESEPQAQVAEDGDAGMQRKAPSATNRDEGGVSWPGMPASAAQDDAEDASEQASQRSAAQRRGADLEEASQQGSEEDDRLEELMGAVPTINLRELRTQVASLPEILSRAQRTAELCARGSAPGGLAGNANLPRTTDASIHSWVAQSRATAILMQRDSLLPQQQQAHSFSPGALQPRPRAHEAAAEGARADLGSAAGNVGCAGAKPRRRLTARRSLADVRAAIGIAPSQDGSEPGDSPEETEEEQPSQKIIKAEREQSGETQKKPLVKLPSGFSVWGRLASVFPGRRVRPDSADFRPGSAMSSTQPTPWQTRPHQMSMTERLFGTKASHAPAQKVAKGIILSEWPQKKEELSAEQAKKAAERSTGTLPPAAKPGPKKIARPAETAAVEGPTLSAATSVPCQPAAGPGRSTRKVRRHNSKATLTRTGMAGRWRMEACKGALAGQAQVEDLLDLPLLQRLAQQRAQEIQIQETNDTFDFSQTIPLNGNGARIVRRTCYPRSGKMVESARADSREGVLRSQLNISPEGHCHIRSLQGEPYAAVFHRRIKVSSGGNRLKIEQKFQLLSPGVTPVKYHSIWHRIEDSPASKAEEAAAFTTQQEPLIAM